MLEEETARKRARPQRTTGGNRNARSHGRYSVRRREIRALPRSVPSRVRLVERADRLARDLLVSEVILGQFRDLGVRVVAADSGTDLTAADEDPTRVLIRQVLGAVSQFEKSVIVAKLRAARLRQRRQTGTV
jgi:DNA invertase Pin-like site-specific DNA recombinase